MAALHSFGLGIGTRNGNGDWLEVYYPRPLLSPADSLAGALADSLDYDGGNESIALDDDTLDKLADALDAAGEADTAAVARGLRGSARTPVAAILASDEKPASVPEVYLKLHLLSHRLARPHSLVLDGMFGVLANVAWTSEGPIDLAELPARQLQARLRGETLAVDCVDKFPKMTDYVVPAGVRIADPARVRLGAYLGEGTTVMHEGFVNFNAGTEGPNMIEGRISAGVFVGTGSDLGGGCSTMGTLSGGGNIVIAVGRECLIECRYRHWGIAARWRQASTSPPAPAWWCWTTTARRRGRPRPGIWRASPTCCSGATPSPVPSNALPTAPPWSSTRPCTPITDSRRRLRCPPAPQPLFRTPKLLTIDRITSIYFIFHSRLAIVIIHRQQKEYP